MVVSPGEEVAFHLSSPSLRRPMPRLVRVRCADPDPAGPGIRVHDIGAPFERTVSLVHQVIRPGSCAIVADTPALTSFQIVHGRRFPVADDARRAGADHPVALEG